MVTDLIDTESKQWNRELIIFAFEEGEANRILSVPLAVTPQEDALVWSGEGQVSS